MRQVTPHQIATPLVKGFLKENLSGGESPVTSGPKSVNFTFSRKNSQGNYEVYLTSVGIISSLYKTSDNSLLSVPTDNTSSKYTSFTFTPSQNLAEGEYKVLVNAIDISG